MTALFPVFVCLTPCGLCAYAMSASTHACSTLDLRAVLFAKFNFYLFFLFALFFCTFLHIHFYPCLIYCHYQYAFLVCCSFICSTCHVPSTTPERVQRCWWALKYLTYKTSLTNSAEALLYDPSLNDVTLPHQTLLCA